MLDKKFRKYLVISFNGEKRTRVLPMNQKGAHFKSQLVALDKIYQTKGKVGNIEVGQYYSNSLNSKNDDGVCSKKMAGVGRRSVLLANETKKYPHQVVRK